MGIPIEPRAPNEMRKLMLVANLLTEPAVMFVTSTRWARIAEELRTSPEFVFKDPADLPTPDNFTRFTMGHLTVVNAGTEDVEAVETANWLSVPASFLVRKRELKAGYGRPRVQPVEAM